ncbi:MAG: phosphopantetheine-binding protein [Thermodesulfobacteriota bacterium]
MKTYQDRSGVTGVISKETVPLQEVKSRLMEFLGSEIFDPSVQIEEGTDLLEAGLDSMSLLQILMFVESSFDLRIPEAEINEERIRFPDSIAQLIYELQAQR